MNGIARQLSGVDLHKLQQVVKWIVYSLLTINFVFYIYEDADRAFHTLTQGSPILDVTNEFATTIDTLAWLLLIAMFELETYAIEDEDWTAKRLRAVHGIRIVSYLMIAHTVFAFSDTVIEYSETRPVPEVSNLCEMTSQDVSFVYNLAYTEVTAETCGQLPVADAYFFVGDDPVVTTAEGLALERDLALSDLIEIIVWLIIIALMELVVRLQGRGVTEGPLLVTAHRAKMALYLVLFGLAVYWANLSHWLYTWDTFVWIGGFAAIEMNVSEWRDEMIGEATTA